MMADFDFSGLTVAELTTLRTNALDGLNAVLTNGTSYSMMGRSFTKSNAAELSQIISAITRAIDQKSETSPTSRFAYVRAM